MLSRQTQQVRRAGGSGGSTGFRMLPWISEQQSLPTVLPGGQPAGVGKQLGPPPPHSGQNLFHVSKRSGGRAPPTGVPMPDKEQTQMQEVGRQDVCVLTCSRKQQDIVSCGHDNLPQPKTDNASPSPQNVQARTQ